MPKPFEYGSSCFIGETTRGLELPVFYDSHTPIWNNRPPGTVISGAPGSGKTFFGLTLAAISAILGKTTVVLDPKGDFISLMNLEDQIGEVNLWDLSDGGQKGVLDPFRMAKTPGEKLALAITVIELFVGGLTDDQKVALAPIVKDVIEMPTPSLGRVVDELRGSEKRAGRELGTQLDLLSHLPLAKLCFAPSGTPMDQVEIGTGLTVITLVGVEMPKAEDTSDSPQKRMASGVIYLLTDFIRRIMRDDKSDNPKSVIIDEAWAVLSTPAGASVIKDLALLGRSKSLALTLITQNDTHLKHLDIENTISSRFAFRSDQKEAGSIVNSMNLPDDQGFDELIVDLEEGECLMQDFRGRFSTVKISSWRSDWKVAFNTNPLEKARAKKALAEEQRKARRAGQ